MCGCSQGVELADPWRIGTRKLTIGVRFAIEQPRLAPLPDEPFEAGIWLTRRRPVQPGHEASNHL
jgi:hypothetical protein